MTDPILTGVETDAKGFWAEYKSHIIVGVACLILGAVLGHFI